MPIRLVLADDHPVVLDGLEQRFRREPDFEVVARCGDGAAALEAVRLHRPDVLLLDVRMPKLDGLEVLREVAALGVPTRSVLLTAALDDTVVVEAVRLGVAGLVRKETATEVLIDVVRQVSAGGRWFDQQAVGRALEEVLRGQARQARPPSPLTDREREVVRLVATGLQNREIGARLFISEGTVKTHLHNIYQKLEVEGRLELTLYAQEKGLL